MRRAAVLVLVVLTFGCNALEVAEPVGTPAPQPAPAPAPQPAPAPAPQPAPAPAPQPAPAPEPEPVSETVEARGDGDGNSAPFDLAGGDYLVTVVTRGPCYYALDLNPLPEQRRTSILRVDEARESTTYLYGVKPGRYYVSAITGPPPSCGWEVTFVTPLQ